MVTGTAVLAQMYGGYGDGMGYDGGWSWAMMIIMVVVTVVVVGGIIWAIVFASRSGSAGSVGLPPSAGPSPREILDHRYARGEIETADYEDRRSRLS